MQSAVLARESEATDIHEAVEEFDGSRTLNLRQLLRGTAGALDAAAGRARRSLARHRMDRRRWAVDYQRLEEVREEAFMQLYRNGGLR
jgi:hypothetical protein